MALNLRGLCRLNINLTNNTFFKSNVIKVGVRCIYQEKDLGVTGYEQARLMFRNQFMTIEDTFRTKMKQICEKEDGVVYTEDLKALIHLAQKNEEDMELLNKMFEKYLSDTNSKKFGAYIFGPVVMRMYYYLNEPRHAMNMFENPAFSNDFNYRATFRVLMCLLYKHNMFQEMRQVYDKILTDKGINFIGQNNVLLYAACLKENTEESFTYALNCWKKQINILKPTVKSCGLIAYLAIKNNQSETALEILALTDNDRVMSLRNLKLLAYMNLQKWIQIVPLLRYSLEYDTVGVQKQSFFADVICELEEKLKSETVEAGEELLQLIDKIKKHELFETSSTLEEFLLRPITITKTGIRNKTDTVTNRNYMQQRKGRNELRSYL